MEFEGAVGVVVAVVGKDVEEGSDEVEGFAGDVGDLEDGTDALGDELRCGLNGICTVFDEDGDFASTGRLEDAGELGDGLLQDLGWADVDFGDDDHHWHVKREGDAQMLSGIVSALTKYERHQINSLAHANQTIIGGDHEEAIIGTAA